MLSEILKADTNKKRQILIHKIQNKYGCIYDENFLLKIEKNPEWESNPDLAGDIFDTLIQYRQGELDRIHSLIQDGKLDFDEVLRHYNDMLLAVLSSSHGDFSKSTLKAIEAAKSQDIVMREAAAIVIDKCEVNNKIDLILQYMDYNGVDCIPYKIGSILIKTVNGDQEKMSFLREKLKGSYGRRREGLLQTIVMMKEQGRYFQDELIFIAENGETESKNLAIIALGYMDINKEIESILKDAAYSKEWFIRGNSIFSASLLNLEPGFFLERAKDLINDTTGYDWTVQEKVVQAIGNYGTQAANCLGFLAELKKGLNDNDELLKIIDQSIMQIKEEE